MSCSISRFPSDQNKLKSTFIVPVAFSSCLDELSSLRICFHSAFNIALVLIFSLSRYTFFLSLFHLLEEFSRDTTVFSPLGSLIHKLTTHLYAYPLYIFSLNWSCGIFYYLLAYTCLPLGQLCGEVPCLPKWFKYQMSNNRPIVPN